MIFRKYGITITRIKEKDIELVRQMRNSPEIQSKMYYKEYITPEMQKKWFQTVNNKENGYFIIEYAGQKIGLIHGKNNDFEKRISEGGIFIWDKGYINTIVPALASIILADYTFLVTHYKATYGKVLLSNKQTLEYNKLMGYVPCEPLNNDTGVEWMILTHDNYFNKMKLLRKGIKVITGDGEPIKASDIDYSDDSPEEMKLLYSGLPPDIQKHLDDWTALYKK